MKAVILDMYGVIVKDTGDGFYEFVNRTFPKIETAYMYKEWDRANIGEITSLEVLRVFGYKDNVEKVEKEYLDSIEINEGFYDFALEVRKHCKLALISNDISNWSSFLRDKYKLNEYFDVITVSGDLKIKKPDKRIFEYTLESLGCIAEECVYVDDRRSNLNAARAMGMAAVLFNSRNVEYDGKIVRDFKELEEYICQISV